MRRISATFSPFLSSAEVLHRRSRLPLAGEIGYDTRVVSLQLTRCLDILPLPNPKLALPFWEEVAVATGSLSGLGRVLQPHTPFPGGSVLSCSIQLHRCFQRETSVTYPFITVSTLRSEEQAVTILLAVLRGENGNTRKCKEAKTCFPR